MGHDTNIVLETPLIPQSMELDGSPKRVQIKKGKTLQLTSQIEFPPLQSNSGSKERADKVDKGTSTDQEAQSNPYCFVFGTTEVVNAPPTTPVKKNEGKSSQSVQKAKMVDKNHTASFNKIERPGREINSQVSDAFVWRTEHNKEQVTSPEKTILES